MVSKEFNIYTRYMCLWQNTFPMTIALDVIKQLHVCEFVREHNLYSQLISQISQRFVKKV